MNISYVKIFNQVVDEFYNELIEIFPEEVKIKVQYTLFQTIIKVNSKKPCTEFMTKSIPFLEKIAMRDEQLVNNFPFLENIWTSDLSNATKNAIWRYIQSLFTIGFKIIEMTIETHDIINYIIKLN